MNSVLLPPLKGGGGERSEAGGGSSSTSVQASRSWTPPPPPPPPRRGRKESLGRDGAGRGGVVEGLAHVARLVEIFGGQDRQRRTPRDRLARQQQRFGKVRLDQIDVVQSGEYGALFAVPAPHQVQKIGRGLAVDRGKRL